MKRVYLLLLCAGILLLAACSRSGPADDPIISNTAPPTAAAVPAPAPTPTPTPTPRTGGEVVTTAAPGSTPSPITIPSVTAEPETADSFAPVDVSGTFRSDTGTALNLYADWECVSVSAKNVRLSITLSLESYSLDVGERNRNQLVVNGVPVTFHTEALEVPSGSGLGRTVLYTWSETMPLNEDGSLQLDVYASWEFSGSYSGVEMETLEVRGHISLP